MAKMALPLIPDLFVGRFALSVSDNERCDVPKRRKRLCGPPRSSPLFDRVDALRNQAAVFARLQPRVFEADVGVGAESLIVAHAADLIAQHPLLATGLAYNEMQSAAVAAPAGFCGLNRSVCQPRHSIGPTSGPTLRRGLSHTRADTGIQKRSLSPGNQGSQWTVTYGGER